ncbi:MAG: MerR family transcriptional regulator [bacterium]
MDLNKPTFTIQQLSERLEIPRPTLRFWEKELEGVIVPLRTPGGQRRYTMGHCLIIEKIKKLRDEGMNLAEIKRELRKNKGTIQSASKEIDQLAEKLAEIVKAEVYNFFSKE